MKVRLLPLSALFVLGCATTSSDTQWIVGRWCPDGATTYAGAVVGLWPTHFYADGTYSTFEEEGVWRLEGQELTRLGALEPRALSVDRVERFGLDTMAWARADSEREIWRRCAEGP